VVVVVLNKKQQGLWGIPLNPPFKQNRKRKRSGYEEIYYGNVYYNCYDVRWEYSCKCRG